MPSVAIVLPPREAFSPDAAGAVAMVARSHARFGALPAVVLGRDVARPFPDARFLPVSPSWRLGPEAIRYAGGVARALRAERPDLIEVHNRPDVALFLARRFPAVTLFLHNDPRGMRAARTSGQREILRSRLARVLAVSGWVEDRFGAGPGVARLPNGIDPDALPPITPRERKILFAGRMVADKGADLFVEASRLALPGLPGWAAGMLGADRFGAASPDTAFLRDLRPRAEAAGVAMAGWRPHADVLAAMARASIVVMPGRWPEPFGLAALEALAAGAPLIFCPTGGLTELVGEAGVLVPPDPAAIAVAITALAADPARRAALGQAGRARAKAFAMPRVAAMLDAHRAATLATWSDGAGDTTYRPRRDREGPRWPT